MLVVKKCAWCDKNLGSIPLKLSEMERADLITHGICETCKDYQLNLLEKTHKHKQRKQKILRKL